MKKKTEHPSEDGPGGFLAKNGDHDDKLVVLFPSGFKTPFIKVLMVTKATKNFPSKTYKLKYTGFANPDDGGVRQHWRGTHPLQFYKKGCEIRAHYADSLHIWKIKSVKSGRVD